MNRLLNSFYRSPDEPVGGGDNSGNFGESASEGLEADWSSMPTEPPLHYEPPTNVDGTKVDAKASEADDKPAEPVEAKADEPAKVDADTKEADVVADVKPSDAPGEPAETVVIPDHVANALLMAAKALGVTETDPAKIPDAIAAHNEKLEADRVAELERFEAEQDTKADTDIRLKAAEAVSAIVDPIVTNHVRDEMRKAGYPVDDDDWWLSPVELPDGRMDYDPESTFQRLFADVKPQYGALPQYEQSYQSEYQRLRSEYDGNKTKLAEITTKYSHVTPDVIQDLRRRGVPTDGIDYVAKVAHQTAERVNATINSALTAKDAEIQRLNAQISGHSDAIAKARADAQTEVLETLKQPNPASNGLGGPADGLKDLNSMEPDWGSVVQQWTYA